MKEHLKTFYQTRTEDPTIYPTQITDDLKESINLWFDTRKVCDNENFATYFRRVLLRDYPQYAELLRIEPGVAHYDWLVQSYNESLTESESTGTTESASESESTTDTTGSTSREHESATTTSGQGEATTQASGQDSNANSNRSTSRSLGKGNPMSISYESVNLEGGGLDWRYPETQAESYDGSTGSGTTTYGRRDTTTRQDSGRSSVTDSGTDESANTSTTATSGGTSGSTTQAGTTKAISTGRGVDPATLLENATSYIITSSAFEWLRRRLEVCFMGIY